MPKGYWIARVDIRDAERYKDYVAAAKIAFDKYGARILARGGAYEKAAHECYHSPEYQRAAAIRRQVADGEIVLVEGV
jgi:uncharacterized protein (DUF1330 family)